MLRERLFATLTSAEPEAEEGFEVEGGASSRPARSAAWLDAHARDGRPGRDRGGTAPAGHRAGRDVEGVAPLPPRSGRRRAAGTAATWTCRRSPTTRPRWGSGWPTRTGRRPLHDVKAALHGLARPRLEPRRADQRHRAGRLPRPARPAQLRPRRPRRCATCAASCAPRASRDRPALLSAARRRPTRPRAEAAIVAAPAVTELADALDAELARRGATRLLAEVELPLRRAGRPGDRRRRRRPRPRRAGGRVRAPRSSRPRRTAYGVPARRSTSARPSSSRRCCSTS